MAQDPIVTPGDDIILVQDLYEDGVLVSLTGSTIRACIQNGLGVKVLDWVSCSSSATGANWSQGRVVIEFPQSVTTALSRGSAKLEVEVTRSGKRVTWPLINLEIQPAAS